MGSPPYRVDAGGLTYTVVDDAPFSFDALVTGRVVDEVTVAAPHTPVAATTDLPFALTRTPGNGLFAVVGSAGRVFPALAVSGASFGVTITAPGYRVRNLTVNVPAGATLPVVLADVLLRPEPVRLQGRVVRESDRSPIVGALVTSDSLARVLLRAPLASDHAQGVTVNARPLAPVGPSRITMAAVRRGDTSLTLDNNAGLAGGSLVRVGTAAVGEFMTLRGVGPDPGSVTLGGPLVSSYPAGTVAQAVTPGAVAGSTTLARSGDAGDGLLVLAGPIAGPCVEVVDGPRSEFRDRDAVTDTSGDFRVDGVAGVATLDLRVSAGGFTDATRTVAVAYDTPVNLVGFRLSP